jgi:hypothetical protein
MKKIKIFDISFWRRIFVSRLFEGWVPYVAKNTPESQAIDKFRLHLYRTIVETLIFTSLIAMSISNGYISLACFSLLLM